MNGQQGGDPAKLASALVQLASQDDPPARWVAGADAIATVEQKAEDLLAQADAYRELSSNLAHGDAPEPIAYRNPSGQPAPARTPAQPRQNARSLVSRLSAAIPGAASRRTTALCPATS